MFTAPVAIFTFDDGLRTCRLRHLPRVIPNAVENIGRRTGNKISVAVAYGNLGNLYLTRGDLKATEEMYRKSLAIFTSIGNDAMIRKIGALIEELRNQK